MQVGSAKKSEMSLSSSTIGSVVRSAVQCSADGSAMKIVLQVVQWGVQ